MATRKTPAPARPTRVTLTVDQMRRGIARLERVIAEIDAFDPSMLTERWGATQRSLEATIDGALTSIFDHGTVEYNRYADATNLDHGPVVIGYRDHPRDNSREARQYVAEGKVRSIEILRSAIKWLEDELQDATEIEPVATTTTAVASTSTKVFIVHGHDNTALQSVARFIEQIGFNAIILSEQANQGRTIIEKIEAHGDVGFAVVLLTPDDVGGKTVDSVRPRARQNVLLELGYFIARLGRARVCSLAKGDLEIPTDFAGVVWEQLDDGGTWKTALARELKAAGYAIDWNRVMG
ncbi:nucleotide-binding protein [Burkholderia multivorans]|uniref:TIR domain-containing protein n=1 Tax=Burkholderia multivorans TaxID=87883 RepID=UPI001C264C7A|nr:nucleotide-binding protein [Burkholderia multivorans]MBU9545518.1 nucleotide-binding protein [Burkholderia multivorans]MCA8174417.1 nucleotide-binding protein [Burkholderia multivorans]